MVTDTVVLEGHIVDSLTLSRVLDTVLALDGSYEIVRFRMGRTKAEPSRAEIAVSAVEEASLERILHEVGRLGAVRHRQASVCVADAPADGVFPDGFYATTNLETAVYCGGVWVRVTGIEMDCGIVLTESSAGTNARCVPVAFVRRGDRVVVSDLGVRVTPLARVEPSSAFHFMGNGVSSERRKEIVVAAVVRAMRETRQAGQSILFVGGPAIIHTGAGRYLEAVIEAGWVDVLFAGNALATHDIEHALYGTSLGIEIATGLAVAHGHEHHLRAINAIRRVGGIVRAVESGLLTDGVMHACVRHGVRVVLAGSIRDDGPLPDVITDTMAAQEAMRREARGAGIAIMVATTLHAVATGNLLPASVTTICVDNAADTVTKLMDRGTHQAFGLVTDCEFFLKELASVLCSRA